MPTIAYSPTQPLPDVGLRLPARTHRMIVSQDFAFLVRTTVGGNTGQVDARQLMPIRPALTLPQDRRALVRLLNAVRDPGRIYVRVL